MLVGAEREAREIARQEVRRFARLLFSEIATMPARADGAVNGRDLWLACQDALKRYNEGETA